MCLIHAVYYYLLILVRCDNISSYDRVTLFYDQLHQAQPLEALKACIVLPTTTNKHLNPRSLFIF